MLNLIQWIRKITFKIQRDRVGAYAAQSAYFTILSFFPFVMFLLTMLKYLPVNVNTMLEILFNIFPEGSQDVIRAIIEEITEKSSGALVSVTIITLIWSAGKGLMAITGGLNSIHEIDESRNYIVLRLFSALYTLIFAVMIIFTLVFLVFGNRLYSWIADRFPILEKIAAPFISSRTILALIVLTVFFLFLYKALPAKKLKLRHQLPGALFASVGWLICSYVFSIYIDYSANISYMYGSLTGIILLMLWLYICMNVVFLGAELNVLIYPEKKENEGLRY